MTAETTITVYTRPGCELCAEAIDTIEQVAVRTDATIDLQTVNVDETPSLRTEYGHRLPCVFVEGTLHFEYRVDPVALEALIG